MTANPYDQCKKNNKAGFLHLKNRNTLKHVFKEKVAIHPEYVKPPKLGPRIFRVFPV